MLDELAKAVHGTVVGDVIYTSKGNIYCSISGVVWLSNGIHKSTNLGRISHGVTFLAAAYRAAS